MSIPLPAFLLRRALLKRARELLEARDPRAALALLGDPLLSESRAARELAARAAVQLEALEAANPPPKSDANGASALKDLLADLRAKRSAESLAAPPRPGAKDAAPMDAERVSSAGAHAAAASALATDAVHASSGKPPPSSVRFRLAIDDAGEYLVVSGSAITIGHLSSRASDLPFLSSIEREHAVLELALDFHGGSFWRIRPLGGVRVVIDGRTVDAAGSALADQDRVRLGENLDFVFRAREPASSSAILDLQHGLECCGAARVLLFASGAEGRVRIGAKRTRQIQVTGLEQDIALEIGNASGTDTGRVLTIRCRDVGAVPSSDAVSGEAPPTTEIACPPAASQRFSVGPRTPGGPPFSIVVSPLGDEAD
jgi:hypothetical protein